MPDTVKHYIQTFNFKKNIILMSAVFLALCVGIGLFTAFSLIKLNSSVQKSFAASKIQSAAIFTANKSVIQMESALIKLIAVNEKIDIRRAAVASIKASSFLDEAIQNLEAQLPNNEAVNNLATNLKAIKPKRMKIISQGKRNKDKEAFDIIQEIGPQADKIAKNLNILIEEDQRHISNLLTEFETKSVQTLQTLGLIITMGMILLTIINSRLRAAKTELRKLNQNLELKVKQRTAQLEESNNEIQKTLDKLQTTQKQLVESEKMSSLGGLVAGVAHEINTPVGISVSAASHLEKKTIKFSETYSSGKISRSDFESYIGTAKESSKLVLSNLSRAAELIQSFKQIAVDQSTEENRKFMIKEYINEVMASLKPKLKQTKHDLILNCPEEFIVNSFPGAIAQILTNLVNNSLQHAFEDIEIGQINIDVTKTGDTAKINFQDSGCGMTPETLVKVFEPFYTTKRGQGRRGLGMHIVWNLVTQSLDGHIDCKSEIDQGLQVIVTFPCNKEPTS